MSSGLYIMKKSFLTLLAMVSLGALAGVVPPDGRAATFQDSDYASIEVPEMAQAVQFFADVLGCEPIGPRSEATSPGSMLLACGPGSVVELTPAPAGAVLAWRDHPIQLRSDDLVATARSLRQKGVNALGKPRRLASGQTEVDLIAPWGLRVELISRPAGTRIAAP
jgi:hypothetical protein